MLTTTAISGARAAARAAFALTITGHPGSLHEATTIAMTNLRFVAALYLSALALRRLDGAPRAAATARVITVTLVLANAVLPGVALAAYGPATAVPFLMHLPLEWLALAIPLATLLYDTPRRLTATTALVVLGALAESFLTPQR